MKRLSLCVFVVCAACLLLAPVALASTKARHIAPDRERHASSAPRSYARLGADPTYAISGQVLDYGGNPVSGARVEWGWWDSAPNYWYGGANPSSGTGTDGSFGFSGVGGHPANDDLTIIYPQSDSAPWLMESWALDFSANNNATLPTPFSYEMQPARVNVHIANPPGSIADVKVGLESQGYAESDMALTAGDGVAGVLPSSFDDVVAGFITPLNPGYDIRLGQVEWLGSSPVAVAAGATAVDTVDLDWDNAQFSQLTGHLFNHSGKPGKAISMTLHGWPAGQRPEFVALYGASGDFDYGTWPVSPGPQYMLQASMKIRPNAPVGVYEIDTYRNDATSGESFLSLWDYFQVCNFKSSASSIRHGQAVRLSGVVPGTGSVTIYSTIHRVTGQPSTSTAKGWHRVGTYKVSSRKFASGPLHPTRTEWYVAKYKGYAFPAFTSVIKVTVR